MFQKKREEVMEIDRMSLPTRHYLLKYVLPKLTEGLTEVAKRRPSNPVEFLAKFMLEQGNQEIADDDPQLDQDIVDEFQKLLISNRKCE